jgi:hypothetical protein
MAPYSIFTVGPNGHFVSVKEIMASSDAAALERARQLLDQLDLEVWSGGRKIAGLSARRRTPAEASWAGSAGRLIIALCAIVEKAGPAALALLA